MSTKRTVINADEELVIKGKLTIEGNVTQIETTQQVTNLQGNVFTINSDSSNTSAVLALNSNGTVASFTFDNANGNIVVNKPINFGSQNITTTGNVTAAYFIGAGSALTGITTTIVSEGTNLYFTAARARGNINVIDAGGDGSLTYSSANGNITYTGPSATEVRAHFSATNGIEYSNTTGVINLASSTAGNGLTYTTGVLAVGAGDGITVNADDVALSASGVAAGTYGNATVYPTLTLAANGRVTAVGTASATIANGSITAAQLDFKSANGVGAVILPAGTTAQRPTAATGMIRYNSTTSAYEGYNATAWTSLGGGATGGGTDTVFVENGQTITTSYTLSTSKNAMSVGAITINSGVVVTIPSGARWVVL